MSLKTGFPSVSLFPSKGFCFKGGKENEKEKGEGGKKKEKRREEKKSFNKITK
jgi:hypothetical protein